MNTTQSIPEAIRQVNIASTKVDELLTAAMKAPAVNGWISLDPVVATEAYIDLEAALQAVRSIAQQLPEGTLTDLAQYLDRAENGLEYSLATISTDTSDQVKAQAGRAHSAQRQLAGLRELSDYMLEKIGRAVLTDIATAVGRTN